MGAFSCSPNSPAAILAAATLFLLAACSSRQGNDAALEPSAAESKSAKVHPAIGAALDSTKAGKYDEGAAKLLQMRASGHQFTAAEAAAYREALEEVYTKAAEAAAAGDPKAKATLEMIRAAGGR